MDELQIALNKAKISLMNRPDSSFFTTLCFSLYHKWNENIPTAATNGIYIHTNPKFFMSLSPEERVFLMLHESLHVAYLHMERLLTRDPKRWNWAGDHVINLQLLERGYKMPKDGLADRQFLGMSTDQVYALAPESSKIKLPMADLVAPESDSELKAAVEDILVRAAIQSKLDNDKPGTIPGEIEFFLDGLLKPKLPWNRILQKYLRSVNKADYTYKKPNRRFFPNHYLPSLYSESMCNIAIAVDASGSVSDEDFLVFISEIHSIFKMMKPEKISLIQFDTRIQSIDELKSIRELSKVKFHGRGGTEIAPVIAWAKANKPQVMLVFSDGHFRLFKDDVKVPIVWLIHNNKKFDASYGKTIHYEI